jgi:anaerobic selenocysteine-containing dehydrogenase
MDRKFVPHHSHWGAFNAVVEDGRVVGAVPFDFDPNPSPLIEAIPDAVHSPTRITRPMVRSGWLQKDRMSGGGRGREPFVPIEREEALDLVARYQALDSIHRSGRIFRAKFSSETTLLKSGEFLVCVRFCEPTHVPGEPPQVLREEWT